MPSADTTAIFRYVKAPSSISPHFVLSAELRSPHQTSQNTNLAFERGPPVLVRDIRTSDERFILDIHGFQVVKHDWGLKDWTDGEEVEGLYYPEVEGLLKRVLGEGVRVEVFNWRVRRSGVDGDEKGDVGEGGVKWSQVLPTAHIDQTPNGMTKRVRHIMGDEAEELLKDRVRMVNIWRPIKHPITTWPLALCNARTISPSDLIPTDFITADYVGEMYNVVYRAEQEWFYLSRQRPEEVLLFKIADSDYVGARYCPHASFEQRWSEDGRPRESIEVRALVFGEG